MKTSKLFLILTFRYVELRKQKSDDKGAEATTDKVSVTIKGSDTVLPLAKKEAEDLMKTNSDVTVTIVGGDP
jgi:phosphate transport system substrate-binding protein